MANKVKIENVQTIPLDNPDMMDIIIGLATRIDALEKRPPVLPEGMVDLIVDSQRRIEELERRLDNLKRLLEIDSVPANKQGYHNPTKTS